MIGLVRDKQAVQRQIEATKLGRDNVHLVQGDLTDYSSLKVGPRVELQDNAVSDTWKGSNQVQLAPIFAC